MVNSEFTPEWRCVKWIGNYGDESKSIEIPVDQIGHSISDELVNVDIFISLRP